VLTASVVAGGLPTEHSFVVAFWLAAAMLLLGFVAALLVPRRRPQREAAEPAPEGVLDVV